MRIFVDTNVLLDTIVPRVDVSPKKTTNYDTCGNSVTNTGVEL